MMIRKKLNQLMGNFRVVCLKLLFWMFLLLMRISMILFLCIITLPCLLLAVIIVGSDDFLQQYRTITANFNEQRATNY
jgi:hypothetical protein|nr:MAG TPA: hypothetical protein [Caudoviricetes sp.]